MWTRQTEFIRFSAACSIAVLVAFAGACSRRPETTGVPKLRQLQQGKEFSGYLSDYSKLKPNPDFENTLSFVRDDPAKNVHKYLAIIVEPVAVYVATNVDPRNVPDRGRAALAEYFQVAITNAVHDAFPVVKESGPLVLRLRSAIIGIDVGTGGSTDQKSGDTLDRAINIGKVGVEMELVDSETGEQIAAAVDRQNLGEGAVVGSTKFSREEKFRAAAMAFDGWAARLRDFLDSAHELSADDQKRADASYRPYGPQDTLAASAAK
jgi:hypothetical protein